MKFFNITISIVALSLFLLSCDKGGVSLGTVKYYPGFIFSDSSMTPVTRTFDLEFSEDAKQDKNCFAEFQFVDNNGKPVSTKEMQVSIGGKELKDNKFKVYSNDTEKQLTFTFSPNAKEGKHQGYLKLVSHNLDRLDSQQLSPGQQAEAFQWTMHFKRTMNPFAKGLLWLLAVLCGLLLLWFLLLKQIVYPRIKLSRLQLQSDDGYYVNKKINGTRMVVVTSNYKPQGKLNRLFTGRILYIKDNKWTSPWELVPNGRKKNAKINLHGKYMIDPVTSRLENYSEHKLTNIETKETVTIKIL